MTSVVTSASKPLAPPPQPRPTPPEWPIERVVKTVGKIPAAAGRILDRLAKVPFIGHVIRLFSSVWLGISILALIGTYIAIGSGFADLRAYLEMTDLQFFDAWPMRILLACLALDLSIVTLRRIPLTLFKLGPWTVHIGILTLIGGCVWYFSHKEEGSVRIYLNQSVNHCYDVTERALYAFPVRADGTFDTDHPVITPIPTLPIYYQYPDERRPALDIALAAGALPGDGAARITGYYPFATLRNAGYRPAEPGESGEGPAISLAFADSRGAFGETWLLASSPAGRVMESNLPFAIEYLRQPTPERLKDLQTSLDGPLALTVRIPKLAIERTYAFKPGDAKEIAIEGSPYTLTPGDVGAMPMLSKGYENAFSSTLMVGVDRKDASEMFHFQRMCVFRYPERSPDFVEENGKQVRKQDGVDPEIQITFHDATQTQAWIVEAADGALSLIVRTSNGKSITQPLAEKPAPIPVAELPGLQVRVTKRTDNAVAVMLPDTIPLEQRPRSQTAMEVMQLSMIDLTVSRGTWSRPHVYVPFSPFAQIGEPPAGRQPSVVDIPGIGKVGLLLATTRRDLPSTLTLTQFEPVKYPGAVHTYADYISTLRAQDPGSSESRTLVTHLNSPASDHGLFYFQAAWDGDDRAAPEKRFSVIGVGNRPGIPVMIAGAILIVLGIGYAFYAKPLLLKWKKESLAAWNAARA